MDLFSQHSENPQNLLHGDSEVFYFGPIFSLAESNTYLNILLNKVAWRHDEAMMFGRKITTKRKVAWYADEAFEYTYSKITKRAMHWPSELLPLKDIVEKETKDTYNSCLLNLYHDGSEAMGWHSDNEKDLKKNGAIASLSFGAERKFSLKHKTTKETRSVYLEHGSLLVMKGTTQDHWLHQIPPSKKIHNPRVNLTFRTIVQNSF